MEKCRANANVNIILLPDSDINAVGVRTRLNGATAAASRVQILVSTAVIFWAIAFQIHTLLQCQSDANAMTASTSQLTKTLRGTKERSAKLAKMGITALCARRLAQVHANRPLRAFVVEAASAMNARMVTSARRARKSARMDALLVSC